MATVVHVAGFSSPYGGNFIASLAQLRKSCMEAGWDTAFLFPEVARERAWFELLAQGGWDMRCFPITASRMRLVPLLAQIVAQEDVCLVHTHFVDYDLSALAAKWLGVARRRPQRRIPLLWHAHSEIDALTSVACLRRVAMHAKYGVLSRGVHMIPVGRSVARQLIAVGVSEERVHLVENGIDLCRATIAARSTDEVLTDLSLDESRRVLLMFGWKPILKGVDTALEAVAAVYARFPAVALVIVGTDELNTYIAEQFDKDPPPWLRVVAPVEDVASLFHSADIFLAPSRSEGFSYSVCEAMANKLPVVLGDIPGVSWARRSPGAVFFPAGDAQALMDVLVEVLDWDEETRAQHGEANEHLAYADFDVTSWSERMIAVYREVLARASIGC